MIKNAAPRDVRQICLQPKVCGWKLIVREATEGARGERNDICGSIGSNSSARSRFTLFVTILYHLLLLMVSAPPLTALLLFRQRHSIAGQQLALYCLGHARRECMARSW